MAAGGSRRRGAASVLIGLLLTSACTSQPSPPSPPTSPSPSPIPPVHVTRSQRATLQLRPVRKLVPPSSPEWEKTRVTCIVGDPSFSSCLVSSLDAQRIVLTGPPSQTRLKYVLGPLIADGGDVARAASIPGQPPGSDWEVAIRLTPEASTTFFAATARAVLAQYPRNVIAIIVRGQIVSAPQVQAAVMRGYIDIRGGFTRREAEALAASLSPGGGP